MNKSSSKPKSAIFFQIRILERETYYMLLLVPNLTIVLGITMGVLIIVCLEIIEVFAGIP